MHSVTKHERSAGLLLYFSCAITIIGERFIMNTILEPRVLDHILYVLDPGGSPRTCSPTARSRFNHFQPNAQSTRVPPRQMTEM